MSESKRILLLDCSPFCGGAQESIWSLAEALAGEGIPVMLLCADASTGGLIERARQHGIPCRSFSARHWPFSFSGACQYAIDHRQFQVVWESALQEFQPTLIHANCLRSLLLLSRGRLADIPVLLHDRDIRCPALLPRILAKRLQKVIAISTAVAEKWQGLLAPERIRIIPNGFALSPWNPTETKNGDSSHPFTVLLVADFVAWKNHALFLATMHCLTRKLPNVHAVIRGRVRNATEAELRRRIEQQRNQLGLQDRVEIIDHPGSAAEQIAATDILVSCAEEEPFGRVLVEALAQGKVVVAVDGAGPAEILRGQSVGSLCPPQAEALSAAILDWHEENKYLKAANAARAVAEKYSLSAHVAAVKAVYDELTPATKSDNKLNLR
ncbi:MAG: glycosyltransferase family 4 protein [Lentisphaeria bacterium]|nr:glycosyltransferase family 4 protein [Lentisphaeria bacterium]